MDNNEGSSQAEVNDGCNEALKRYMAVDAATADKMLGYELAAYIIQCSHRGMPLKEAMAKLGLFWMRLVEETEARDCQ